MKNEISNVYSIVSKRYRLEEEIAESIINIQRKRIIEEENESGKYRNNGY